MKKEISNGNSREKEEEVINLREILFKYIIHWRWFVAAVATCLIVAYAYLYVTSPVYNVAATVLIKDDKKGGGNNAMAGLEGLGLTGIMSSSQSLDNEMEVLRSKSLVKEVVEQLNLYVTYRDEDPFPKEDLYLTSPVQVSLTPQEAAELKKPMEVYMVLYPEGVLDVNVEVEEKRYEKRFDKLPAVFPTDEGTLAFFASGDSLKKEKRHITAVISRPMQVAKEYGKNLNIAPTSKTTSVAVISLKNTSKERGKDFINKLVEMYNRNTNNDKNEIAQKTAQFIDERIGIISKELGSTEANLEAFKRSAGITDLSSDAQIALTGSAEYEKKRAENRTQINLVQDLRKYMLRNEYEVLPSNVGLKDVSLTASIDRYNEMLIERKRLLRTSTEDNPAIVNLNTSIQAMKANVQLRWTARCRD
ncbi:tyrosine-protein kinase Wzc [Bacteroides pyogenes JCM 10003]|nr:tyrosine-protein kinase Wzc [Bacteroides pyogenes JCM 10003]